MEETDVLDKLSSDVVYLHKRISHLEHELRRANHVVTQAYKWMNNYIQQPDDVPIASEKLVKAIDEYNQESSGSLRTHLVLPIPEIDPVDLAGSLIDEWNEAGDMHEFLKLSKEEYTLYMEEDKLPDDFVVRHFGEAFNGNGVGESATDS